MSKLRIFSDPHLGVNRVANTTIDSRRLMQLEATSQCRLAATKHSSDESIICVGDLFDGGKVSNETLSDAYDICQSIDIVVGGNHDMSNNSKDTTSFDLLNKFESSLVNNEVSNKTFDAYEYDDGAKIIAVPHHSTQELFNETLKDLIDVQGDALFLHCTYDFNIESSNTSINLTPDQAEELLKNFKRIFIGHEHAPSEHMGGGVIMVGSTLPFNMGEIGDRYVYTYDTDTDNLTRDVIWDASTQFADLVYSTEISEDFVLGTTVQFVDINGSVPSEHGPELAAWVAGLWQSNPQLLMVRNQVKVGVMEGNQIGTKEAVLRDLSATIEGELEDSDLKPVWDKYKEA